MVQPAGQQPAGQQPARQQQPMVRGSGPWGLPTPGEVRNVVADLQRASAPYMPRLRGLMALPGAQQARADLVKGLQASHVSSSRLVCMCCCVLSPRASHALACASSSGLMRHQPFMYCVPACEQLKSATFRQAFMPLVLWTQERIMARTVKMLFGGGPADPAAEPALTGGRGAPADRAAQAVLTGGTGGPTDRAAEPALPRGNSRAQAPINWSAAGQRTPTARVLSAAASSAGS